MAPTTPLTGIVYFRGDPGYDQARQNFNARFSLFPRVIVFCEQVQDVSNAVKWACKNQVEIRIRSGGHSYEAFSLVDGGIVIDVSRMKQVQIDKARGIAVVGAGIRMLPLYEALWKKGVTLPGGTCPYIGVAGLTLGGGFGLLSRRWGLTCDNLVGVEMVGAGGQIIRATERTNADLLWAMQGGGSGSFGIVTSFTFRVHPIGDVAIYRFKWKWGEIQKLFEFWQGWAPELDDRLTSILNLPAKDQAPVSSVGQSIGLEKDLRRLLQPLLGVSTPTEMNIRSTSFIEAARSFAGIRPEEHHVPPERAKFKNSTAYVSHLLEPDAVQVLLRNLDSAPPTGNLVQLDSYGGAINRLPADATAFPHRHGTKYHMQYQAYWSEDADEQKNLDWIEQFRTSMLPYTSGAYFDYCDRNIKDWPTAYYGANFERLKQVKKKYDPGNVFHFDQSIPVAE